MGPIIDICFYNIHIILLLINQPNIDINMKSIQIINRYDDWKSIRTPLHDTLIMQKNWNHSTIITAKSNWYKCFGWKNRKPIYCTDDQAIEKLFHP